MKVLYPDFLKRQVHTLSNAHCLFNEWALRAASIRQAERAAPMLTQHQSAPRLVFRLFGRTDVRNVKSEGAARERKLH